MCQKLILILIFFFSLSGYTATPEENEAARKRLQTYISENKERITANLRKATLLALERAKKGDSKAMLFLSSVALSPSASEEVKKESSEWLHLAADYGNVEAQIRLGNAYRNGDSLRLIAIDLEKAKKYLKLASDSGDTTANFYYKDLIECGFPVQEAEDCD